MVITVQASWVVDLALLLAFFHVEFTLRDNRPARLGNYPERCDAVVL